MRKIFILFIILFIPLSASSLSIDLTKMDLYIREGFKETWTQSLSDKSKWIKIPGVSSGSRSIKINSIKELNPQRASFLSLKTFPVKEYTMLTSFVLSNKDIIDSRAKGLFIPHIGQGWQVYCNGNLIKNQLYLNKDGSLQLDKSSRNILIYLNPLLLKIGKNILTFRVIGNPDSKFTGIYRSSPFTIGNYKDLFWERISLINIIIISIYLIIGIYHLLLFANRTKETYNFYFGATCVFLFIYLFNRTSLVVDLFSDSSIFLRGEYISLFILFPLMGCFFDQILSKKISRFIKGYFTFSLVLATLTTIAPLTTTHDILTIWQLTIPIPLLYILGIHVYYFAQSITYYKNKNYSKTKSFFYTLIFHSSGNLLIGTIVMAICVIIDIISTALYSTGTITSRYAFFLFIFGITIMLTNRFLFIHKKVESLNKNLTTNIESLNYANTLISISEQKYRSLVENSNDAIFTIKSNGDFITANKAIDKLMGIKPGTIEKYNLLDLIYDDTDRKVNYTLLNDIMQNLVENKEPANLKVQFKSKRMIEPRDLQLRLEYIQIDHKEEILGKANLITEDILLQYFKEERQSFEISNYLITADEISHRITRNLRKYLDKSHVSMIRLALREIIINSIEHGNLNISFDEKSDALENGTYIDIVTMRQKDPLFKNKKVSIEYTLTSSKVIYKITDEGDGFEASKYLNKNQDELNNSMLTHGRGIFITKEVFEHILYNKKGNSVELIKNFNS